MFKVDENGKIIDAKFKTFGCGSAIASSSLATEWIKGRSVTDANTIKNQDIAKELCLPPVKLHCSSKFHNPLENRDLFSFQCLRKMRSKQRSLIIIPRKIKKPNKINSNISVQLFVYLVSH